MWWDLWHYHADWDGRGNLGWRLRRAHFTALAAVFLKIGTRAAEFPLPFQAWIFLSGVDARADATYLHTPNPNAQNFPLCIPELRFDTNAAAHVAAAVQQILPGLRVGEVSYEDPDEPGRITRDFILFSEGVGLRIGSARSSLTRS